MEPRGKTITGRRQFLCGCCATLTSAGLGAGFAAAATDPVVVPVESAPFHLEVFQNEYVRFLNVLIPPGEVAAYHRHSIDFAYLVVEATDRLDITVLDKPMALVSLKTAPPCASPPLPPLTLPLTVPLLSPPRPPTTPLSLKVQRFSVSVPPLRIAPPWAVAPVPLAVLLSPACALLRRKAQSLKISVLPGALKMPAPPAEVLAPGF